MSTRKTADGAQPRTDGADPRPWTPISDGNGDTLGDVDDAEPDADVVVRPDRTVWVAQDTRHNRAFHLFPDCHLRGDESGAEVAGEISARLKLCDHCEMREKVRVAVSDDEIPPNPTVEAGVEGPEPHTPKMRERMPDGVSPEDAGDWLATGNGARTNPRDAQ